MPFGRFKYVRWALNPWFRPLDSGEKCPFLDFAAIWKLKSDFNYSLTSIFKIGIKSKNTHLPHLQWAESWM